MIYERYNLFSTAGVRATARFGLPMLLEINAPIYAERKRFDGIALDGLARASERDRVARRRRRCCRSPQVLAIDRPRDGRRRPPRSR